MTAHTCGCIFDDQNGLQTHWCDTHAPIKAFTWRPSRVKKHVIQDRPKPKMIKHYKPRRRKTEPPPPLDKDWAMKAILGALMDPSKCRGDA